MTDKKKDIVSASPKTRKFARELGADLHLIEGSQREGRVTEDDIKLFIKKIYKFFFMRILFQESSKCFFCFICQVLH